MPSTLGIVASSRVKKPLALSNFWYSSAGNGDNRSVTFTWSNTPTNYDITGHRINIYNSSDTLIGSVDSSGPTATSVSYTFPSNSTTYRARLYTKGGSEFSDLAALTPASNRRLSITTGAASYSYNYDNSYWGAERSFVPTYWTESTWPGKPYNDYTYYGGRAFDQDGNTRWSGQWWAWPGGSDWVGFKIGAGSSKILVKRLLNFTPSGFNEAGTITLDQWDGANFNWMGIAWGGGRDIFNSQVLTCNFEIAANTTGYYRTWYTDLGYNPSEFGSHSVTVNEIGGVCQDWVVSTGTTNVAATANSITDG